MEVIGNTEDEHSTLRLESGMSHGAEELLIFDLFDC